MEGYPFLEADLGSDYENARGNTIGKVQAYHENRAYYEQVCQQFPEHRLAFDKGAKQKAPTKASRADRVKKIKKDSTEQKGLFDGD